MKTNGFKAILPGIESWYDMGNKSKTGSATGIDKVRQVADHVNLVAEYIPYIQTNMVFGIDGDEGPEPFELTKRFLAMAPAAFPAEGITSPVRPSSFALETAADRPLALKEAVGFRPSSLT